MKKLAITVSLALMITTVPALAAQAPKAGASCPKAGVTTTFQGKKFTCLKNGKKLAWGKGVAIKSSSEVAGKPTT
ncbi:MAG: hypothetical protein EBW75_05365, partial [Actinobacteria bacterium]|nr:hypothetical protein [Actinomycetota bacterium]